MAILTRRPVRALLRTVTPLAAVLALAHPARAQAQSPDLAARIKAAYLVNFTRYVQWPADAFTSASEPIVLCVVGRTPLQQQLEEQAAGRTSQGRPIAVRRIYSRPEARGCHVVFITFEEWRTQPDLAASLVRPGVLTVGESDAFAEEGGIIAFVPVEQSLRFAVNLRAGAEAGLGLSSRMLSLATRVYGDSSPEVRE